MMIGKTPFVPLFTDNKEAAYMIIAMMIGLRGTLSSALGSGRLSIVM